MISKTNSFLTIAFFALFLCLSCDDEPLDNALQDTVETILPNSDLATLMTAVSSADNFDCVDFQYPISFVLYNANFQVLERVTIQNDGDLLTFLASWSDNGNGAVLASLNFPVTLVYENATTVIVNNNEELQMALTAASDICNDTVSCDLQTVRTYLVACPQIPTLNDYTPSLTSFVFQDSNALFSLYEGDLPYNGTWDIATIEGEIHVFINFNGLEDFNGEWTVTGCHPDELILQQNDDTLIISKQCQNENPLDCFSSFDAEITRCDEFNDGVETFDLTQAFANCSQTADITLTYHVTEFDAQSNVNALPNPSAFTNITYPETVYVRVELLTDGTYEVFPIQLMLEDCDCNNPGTLTNDLILYMPFSEQAKDLISGYSVPNLTNSYVADRNGNPTCAIAFDGNNHFSLPVSIQNQLVQGDNFSVSIWFKMQNTEPGNFETIFQKGTVNSEGFQLAVYDLNTPLVSDSTNGYGLWDNDWNQQVDVQWENTDWHHLVVTRDSNNTIRLFRDGVMRNVDENSNFNIDDEPMDAYIIGQFFQGHLDDLRVYKRTLSPNEVSALYTLEGDCYQCL